MKLRLLKEACTTCSYLFPHAKNTNSCLEDPECPANKIEIEIGRDPERLSKSVAESIIEDIYLGNEDDLVKHMQFFRSKSAKEEFGESYPKMCLDIMRRVVEDFDVVVSSMQDAEVAPPVGVSDDIEED